MKLPKLLVSANLHRISGFCFLALVLFSLFFASPHGVHAQVVDDEQHERLLNEIKELEEKLAQTKAEKTTLSDNIQYINNKISLNEKEIEKTKYDIVVLNAQINDLGQRIVGLESSLGELSEALIDRVQTQYKRRATDPVSMVFATTGLSDFFKEHKYYERVRSHTQELLLSTELKRQVYDEERTSKEDKQTEMEVLQQRLNTQQADLRQQEQAKQQLLAQTKNSEANYSRLLAEAREELNSLSRFTETKSVSGVLPAQNSPDGWYFSQRDERWAKNCVGLSCDYNIYEVGCLISSTAMVKKKFGENVTPGSIAGDTSNFFGTTAYMLRPYPAPAGYSYAYSGYNPSLIDAQLEKGNPVIVKLNVSTQYSTHFVVLKEGSAGNYTMHDPWEGFDKKFTEYYSVGQISSVAYLIPG